MQKRNNIIIGLSVIVVVVISIVIISILFGFLNDSPPDDNGDIISQVKVINYSTVVLEDMAGEEYTKITIFIKNNGNTTVDKIKIITKFYNTTGEEIQYNKTSYVYNLKSKETQEFTTVYHSLSPYYYKADWKNIKFDLFLDK